MSWIYTKEVIPTKEGMYWCYAKTKKKPLHTRQLEFKEGRFFHGNNKIPFKSIKAWSESKECPTEMPIVNQVPTTNKEIFFKRMELIGDAAIPCIITHYCINKGYQRKLIQPIVNFSVKNRNLATAGINAGLNYEVGNIVITKQHGSAFEFEVGKILSSEGYENAYNYVVKWLVPIILDNMETINTNKK